MPTDAAAPPKRSRLRGAVTLIPFALAVALAAVVLVPGLLGFERYVITSGSMTGAFDRGSLVFAEKAPVSELRVGDVITYTPPPDSGVRELVTHRIVSAGHNASGRPVFRTKGDANPTADPWTFTLDTPVQARASFDIPYVGYTLAALSDRTIRMLLIGLPALFIALSVLIGLWRDAGRAAREAPRRGVLDSEF